MKVLIVSGIWPPDVGGPASHAPELAAFLRGRGHRVEVVITADRKPAPEEYPIHHVARRLPVGIRHAAVAALVARRARDADVVYATSMLGRAVLGATLARRPIVVKLVADEAYERARRRGLYDGDLDGFQQHAGDWRIGLLRAVRDRALRRVSHLVCPSGYLADLAVRWGVPRDRVTVLPNPAPPLPRLAPRDEIRRRLGLDAAAPALAFAGRVTRQKALEVALEAVAELPDVTLLVAGDGPDLPAVRSAAVRLGVADRVRFLGQLDRQGVLELFRAADLSVLSSDWENFPHTVVEALAVGTSVVATGVGGVAEVVLDGVNGLIVPPREPALLAAAIRRFLDDPALAQRLRDAAAPSVDELGVGAVYTRLEDILERGARP